LILMRMVILILKMSGKATTPGNIQTCEPERRQRRRYF
jgi:hypothetical protein